MKVELSRHLSLASPTSRSHRANFTKQLLITPIYNYIVKKGSFLELARKRRSTFEYSDKKVPERMLKQILEAGRLAPSLLNTQPWQFVVVKNKKQIRRIMCTAHYGYFYSDPPILICIVLDAKKVRDLHRGISGDLEFIEAVACVGTAAMNMLLAATDLGINTSIVTPKKKTLTRLFRQERGTRFPLLFCSAMKRKARMSRKKRASHLMSSFHTNTFDEQT